ncbi:hypothetical protein D3C73_1495070 [compost metagenome]
MGFGGGTVDFIRQENIGHDRTGPEQKGFILGVKNGNAGNIGRQQIRIALDPPVFTVNGFGQRFDQNRFAGTGDVFQEYMSSGKKCGDQ